MMWFWLQYIFKPQYPEWKTRRRLNIIEPIRPIDFIISGYLGFYICMTIVPYFLSSFENVLSSEVDTHWWKMKHTRDCGDHSAAQPMRSWSPIHHNKPDFCKVIDEPWREHTSGYELLFIIIIITRLNRPRLKHILLWNTLLFSFYFFSFFSPIFGEYGHNVAARRH